MTIPLRFLPLLWQADVLRRREVWELLQIYRQEWRDLLLDRMREIFSPEVFQILHPKTDISLNLLRWAVDELAGIYAEPVSRTLEGEDAPALYTKNLDVALDAASRMAFLCRTVFVRPLWFDGEMFLDVVTPDRVSVLPSRNKPGAIDCLMLHIPFDAMDVYLPPSSPSVRLRRYAVWTKDSHFILDESFAPLPLKDNPANKNFYGRIPYLAIHLGYPTTSFWTHQEMRGLRDATYRAAIHMTDHNHLRQMQSFKQLVLTGTPESKDWAKLILDPGKAIHLKGQGTADVLDLQADLGQHLDTLLTGAAAVLNLYGIRPDAVKGTIDASSGYALSLKMQGQQKVWSSLRRIWEAAERELYDLARVTASVDSGLTLPSGPLRVAFGEMGAPADPQTQASTLSALVTSGIYSKAEARRVLGKTEEESAQIEEETLAERVASPSILPSVPPIFGEEA